ncbi:urea ABC transporter ATP-binding protein UrtD [soil metagenome]
MTAHLELREVSASFNGFKAVNGLSLAVQKGELRCLIGPNGAGKTTALDLICGKTAPASGSIHYKGIELTKLDDYRIARAGIGRKFQVPSVFRQLTVRENLEVADCKRNGVLSNLFRSANSADSDGLDKLAEFVGLVAQLNVPAGHLSHGQTQWLEIALLLAQNAELILLDEPTAGMTAQETQKTADICNRLKGKHTIIVVEHDMGFVKEIGDIISVMHQGKLLAEGTVAQVESDPMVRQVYLGSVGISGA